MSYRDDILWAADMIERHPEAYSWSSVDVPNHEAPECGSPGCALGWIAAHQEGREVGEPFTLVRRGYVRESASPVGVHSLEFYGRMGAIEPRWKVDAKACAAALRRYADHYHPESDAIPSGVRAIFQREESQREQT